LLDAVERILESSWAKLLLAMLIVVSVLPREGGQALDGAFFVIFGVEILLRLLILCRKPRITRGEAIVLAADLIALTTFLPIPEHLVGMRNLRFIRLARLLVLGRFLSGFVADLRRILGQRLLRHQLAFLLAAVVFITLLGSSILATFGSRVDDFDNDGTPDEGTLSQLLWWVFRQVEDPGNLVEDSGGDVVLLLTSLALTIAGVFVMSFIIGIGTSVVGSLVAGARSKPVGMRNHSVVLGGGRNVREVIDDMLELKIKNHSRGRLVVLDDEEDLPAYLDEPRYRSVEYRSGEVSSLDSHRLVSTDEARRVIVLNNEERGQTSDAYVVSSLLAVREQNESCPVVAEMRHRRNIEMAKVAGGQNVHPVAMGWFLGNLMAQNLMFPGIDAVFEELLTARGSEIYTHVYEPRELDILAKSRAQSASFSELLLSSYGSAQIIPIGVLLGDEGWSRDGASLEVWLNPLDEPLPAARALGAAKGEIPLAALRGLIAISPDYSALRKLAVARATEWSRAQAANPDPGPAPRDDAVAPAILGDDMTRLKKVVILGDNEVLPALVENATSFVSGLELLIVTQTRARRRLLEEELEQRPGWVAEMSDDAMSYCLANNGRVTLTHARGRAILTEVLSHPFVRASDVDGFVLLADHEETDPDAISGLMLLRILELVGTGGVEVSPRFRLIAEVLSGPKGALLERRLCKSSAVPVRIIPTQQMRAYFLVHSAQVPCSDRIHLELMSAKNQDFCQLVLRADAFDQSHMRFCDLLEALSKQSPPAILIALSLDDQCDGPALVLNPGPRQDTPFRVADVKAVYAVAETERLIELSASRSDADDQS